MDDAVEHTVGLALSEGGRALRRVGDELAEREDVGRRAHVLVQGLLGGHEGRCPHGDPGIGEGRGVDRARDAEIDYTGAVRGQQHVGRLQVPVDDAFPVHRLKCLGHPCRQQ